MLVVWTVFLMCMISGDAQVVKEIKLFDVMNLTQAGVNETQGYHSNSKAYEFTDSTGPLVANASISRMFATQAFTFNEFAVNAYLQTPSDSTGGTIVFFSRGAKIAGSQFSVEFRWTGDDTIKVESGINIMNTGLSFSCEINGMSSYRTSWLHLTVRVHILEKLIRCKIEANDHKVEYRYAGNKDGDPIDKFPLDGKLRLAQQLLTGSEHLRDIKFRFQGKLQDVVISFGEPNCTIIISDKQVQPPSTQPTDAPSTATLTCPTQKAPVEDNTCIDGMSKIRSDGEEWEEGKFVKCSCSKRRTFCVKSVKRCLYQGTEHSDGSTWDDLENCDKCKCKNGVSECESTNREFKKEGCSYTCADNESGPCPESKRNGCFCPGKKILLEGKCVDPLNCPCVDSEGKKHLAGVTYVKTATPGCVKMYLCFGKKLRTIDPCP